YQNTNFKFFHYYLPAFEVIISTKQLSCRYSTKKIPSLINCDLYDTSLKNHYKAKVFIYEHGYHIICYNAIEEK
ncbi:17059_t:CDS:1, partial [Cetraspora pellucida]